MQETTRVLCNCNMQLLWKTLFSTFINFFFHNTFWDSNGNSHNNKRATCECMYVNTDCFGECGWRRDHAESSSVYSKVQVQINTTLSTKENEIVAVVQAILENVSKVCWTSRAVPLSNELSHLKPSKKPVMLESMGSITSDSNVWKVACNRLQKWRWRQGRCMDKHVGVWKSKRLRAAGGQHSRCSTVRVDWNQSTQCFHSVISVQECEAHSLIMITGAPLRHTPTCTSALYVYFYL